MTCKPEIDFGVRFDTLETILGIDPELFCSKGKDILSQSKVNPADLAIFATNYGHERFVLHPMKPHPLHSGPVDDPTGGVAFFDNDADRKNLEGFFRTLMERGADLKDFVAIKLDESESCEPGGYLMQMRLISKFALRHLFNVWDNKQYEAFTPQELTMMQALFAFMEHEQSRWGKSFTDDHMGLRGRYGGDGNYAREQLQFGFMVESNYHSIYRIWSRAWIVTK